MTKRVTRRTFLKGTAAVAGVAAGAGLVRGPMVLAADNQAAGNAFYFLENNTKGKFSDKEVGWALDGKNYKSLAEMPSAPARMGGGGRIYIRVGNLASNKDGESYTDFIEYTHNAAGWFGNTTLVDEFVLPLTIELFNADEKRWKVGITESRSKIFEAYKKDVNEDYQGCVKGTQRIVSPCRADFGPGKKFEKYFDKYIAEIWDKYATEKVENGWTKKVVDGALTFLGPKGEKEICASKPSTRDAFLGTGVLGGLPKFCAAINRHVLGEPEYWADPSKFYSAAPANFYAKFWHEHGINNKAYGFCYDDVSQQDTLVQFPKPVKLVIGVSWD
jgi:hypothetical protein